MTEPSIEPCPMYADVLAERRLSPEAIAKEFTKLKSYKVDLKSRCFAGNSILYHYQLDNLCRVKTKVGSLYEIMLDDKKRVEWWEKVNRYACGSRPDTPATRFFEVYRRCTGAVVFFKPTVAINVYKQVRATSVLDPCAGWGGRLLGAAAIGIPYTGIDTNVSLKPGYDEMVAKLDIKNTQMLWSNALEVDFSTIDYDCVLTSPPYINLEIYVGMTPFSSDDEFYTKFLIPLINKCRKHIRRAGHVCFNISPAMYAALTSTYGYEKCSSEVPMLQQKVRGKDKEDKVYCWSDPTTESLTRSVDDLTKQIEDLKVSLAAAVASHT